MHRTPGWQRGPVPGITIAVLAAIAGCGGAEDIPADPAAAVFQVQLEACEPSPQKRATAVAVGGDLVATVAHPFESARSFELIDSLGRATVGDIVWRDPARDIALLRLADQPPVWLSLGDADDGAPVEVVTTADPDGFVSKPASIVQHTTVTLDGEGSRSALELDAEIAPGDSGSPVVDSESEVVGIVFAAVRGERRGWAIASEELSAVLAQPPDDPIPLSCG